VPLAEKKSDPPMFVSAEIRWFYPDECPANLHRWFGEASPSPGGGKLRIDEYLSQTDQSEVSIKIRGGRPGVEIKGLVAVKRIGGLCALR
jgi:hypothetical protein